VHRRIGPVTAVIHGAGVLADRLIEDKTDTQFAEVFDTKVADVRVARVHGKVKRQGRHAGRRPDWKKAFVVLKKGEKMVEFFDQA
jgi:large subunit ribosomal protein L23